MTEEQRRAALNLFRHLTRAAEAAEKAGMPGTARKVRLERAVVDQAIADADAAQSN